MQLERLAQQFATRDSFSPSWRSIRRRRPATTSGAPYLDEDYLILSTVHSAKGQEWDAVYILNVADGNFPSEFSTGRSDQIEEERRLLYVAMTRAKNDLHLIAPLKYYVDAISRRMGDRHVYGAKSRFLTKAVMTRLDDDHVARLARRGRFTRGNHRPRQRGRETAEHVVAPARQIQTRDQEIRRSKNQEFLSNTQTLLIS